MIDSDTPLELLGGISPRLFMRRYWQRKPLLVRNAIAGFTLPLSDRELFALAGSEQVQSRLIVKNDQGWELRNGPFSRRQLPPLKQQAWTLLLQSIDLHNRDAHALLQQFAFVPQARLDDLMVSYATDGGGVGPHFDSYDVFLLQAKGTRRWRIGKQRDLSLQPDVPLRILASFEPEQEWLLEPGDMLYLPPRYAHDGIAVGNDCITCSIGFRSPGRDELASALLERLAEPDWESQQTGSKSAENHVPVLYRDPGQPATENPGEIPEKLQAFARDALKKRLNQKQALEQSLGEYLSEPAAHIDFEPGDAPAHAVKDPAHANTGVELSPKTRLLYDSQFLYINGQSYHISGKEAKKLRKLADERKLSLNDLRKMSDDALQILQEWSDEGWLFFI